MMVDSYVVSSLQMDPSKTFEDRDKVRGWLIDDGYSVREQSESGLTWFLIATTPDGQGFGISRANGRAETYIRLTVEFDPPATVVLAAMPTADRLRFYELARFTLLSLNAEFQPEGEPLWHRVTFSRRIFPDGLTRDTFFERLFEVHKSAIALSWMISSVASQMPLMPSPGTPMTH